MKNSETALTSTRRIKPWWFLGGLFVLVFSSTIFILMADDSIPGATSIPSGSQSSRSGGLAGLRETLSTWVSKLHSPERQESGFGAQTATATSGATVDFGAARAAADAERRLMSQLEEEHPDYRIEAVAGLLAKIQKGEDRFGRMQMALQGAVSDMNPRVSAAAIDALAQIKANAPASQPTPPATPQSALLQNEMAERRLVMQLSEATNASDRLTALNGLQSMIDSGYNPYQRLRLAVVGAASDADPKVSQAANAALAKMGPMPPMH